MRNFKLFVVLIFIGITLSNCEIPKKPDFTTSQKFEAPLITNKTFQFLGGGGPIEVLIDTTKSEFDSLFVVNDSTSLISLSIEQDFDFGDLNDAIPSISTDPTDFSSQVGELEIGSFSSPGSDLGSADIETVTGNNPDLVPAGSPIFAGDNSANPVVLNIGENTDFFVSATIKRGSLDITVTNNLGFDFSNTIVQVINTGTNADIGAAAEFNSTNGNQLVNGANETAAVVFSEGDQLANLGVRLTIFWDAFNFPANPGDLVVNSAEGNGLVASEVEAALTSQSFSSGNTSQFDNTEFTFTDPTHFVELESGTISIDPILNGLDLTIDSLIISFPGIRRPPLFREQDSLRIRYIPGFDQIQRSSTSAAKDRDLTGFRIFALNNEITYNIYSVTENTQDASVGDQTRVINELDQISSRVEISNLKIKTAKGNIARQETLLGSDDPSNGLNVIDVYNESEVELTSISGLESLSSQIDGLEFTQASLSINYETNLGVPTTIYAVFLAIDGDGNEIFLNSGTGVNSSDTRVVESDSITGILANGQELDFNQMIKITLQPSLSGDLESKSFTFDKTNSNIGPFLNSLPKEIRFLGKSVINQSGGEATISTPLTFDPSLSIDLPLALQTTTVASFSDTTQTDALQDLPSTENGDTAILTEGLVSLNYTNGLPMRFSLRLIFLDEDGEEVTTLPLGNSGETYDLVAAPVDVDSRFALPNPSQESIIIALDETQLNLLYKTTSVIIQASLNTTGNEEVKLRSTDSITLGVAVSVTFENTIN